MRAKLPRVLFAAFAFVSGAAGLAYEVVWHRALAVVLGNSSFATAAVLAAVMSGIGVGSLALGRLADRGDGLRLYGLLELALGITAASVPWLADASSGGLTPLLGIVGPGWSSFAVRFAMAALLLLVPSFLLGATLPALARALVHYRRVPRERVGGAVAVVYAANTLGAAVGCALAGYLFLASLGLRLTSALAGVTDVLLAFIALALSAFLRGRSAKISGRSLPSTGEDLSTEPSNEAGEVDSATVPGRRNPRVGQASVLGLAASSGFLILGAETVWTRLFRIVFGHDVHAFTAMLVCVLVGLSLGAGVYGLLSPRVRAHSALLPGLFVFLAIGLVVVFAAVGHRYLHTGLDILGLESGLSIARTELQGLALQLVFAAVVVLPAAIAAGLIFPALVQAVQPTDLGGPAAGRRVGQVLAANTLGTFFGPLVVSLALTPFLGLGGAALFLGAVAVLAALLLALRQRRHRGPIAVASALVIATALALGPQALPRKILAEKIGPAHLDFLFYEEGRSATVAVVRNQINGERQLFVNGINEVTTRLVHDQSFELLGHLGPLLHPAPERVAVICLGGGLAGGAVTRHPVKEIVVVDLEPAVVGGARRFADLNHDLLDDPRLQLIIDDGRAHLATTTNRYDTIVLDSTHPRAVDSWILYTREFYAIARQALGDNGVLVQWLPLHGLSVDEFRILVNTFLAVFPDATLWTNAGYEPYGLTAYTLLVAKKAPLRIDPRALAERLSEPTLHAALAPWGLHTAEEVLETLHAGPDTLRRWSRGTPINVDDRPLTQFVTEHTRASPMVPVRLLEAFEPPVELIEGELPAGLPARWDAQRALLAGELDRAVRHCPECLKLPMFVAARAEGPAYYWALAERYTEDPARTVEAAVGFLELGQPSDAAQVLRAGVTHGPTRTTLHFHLGLAEERSGNLGAAIDAYRAALATDPDHLLSRINLGRALVVERPGAPDAGIAELERAVAQDGAVSASRAGLGWALTYRSGEAPRAEAELREALRLDPRHRAAAITLIDLLVAQGRIDEASERLEETRRYWPEDSTVARAADELGRLIE
ncbi:MAG: fused MFS/spermidine synthase [Myxococcota bacterium]